jgi:hypothetical protein
MVLLLIPPVFVDYDNAALANMIDTPAYSVVQKATTPEPVAVSAAAILIDTSLSKSKKLAPYSI